MSQLDQATASASPTTADGQINEGTVEHLPRLSALMAPLSGPQRKTIYQLAGGASIQVAAAESRVCRMTVYRWMRDDPDFIAAYNCWKQEVVESAHCRLLELLDEAVDTLQEAVRKGDVKVALAVVRTTGGLRRPPRKSIEALQIRRKLNAARYRDGLPEPSPEKSE